VFLRVNECASKFHVHGTLTCLDHLSLPCFLSFILLTEQFLEKCNGHAMCLNILYNYCVKHFLTQHEFSKLLIWTYMYTGLHKNVHYFWLTSTNQLGWNILVKAPTQSFTKTIHWEQSCSMQADNEKQTSQSYQSLVTIPYSAQKHRTSSGSKAFFKHILHRKL